MQIKQLFDPSRDIYRAIEKVITYGASQEDRLRAEIAEYIATDSIEEQLEKLLSKMQAAMELGGQNEIGVWVSGFYGSGKSSFTKYLGLALDPAVKVDGTPFIKHLQDRLRKPQTRALLSTVATRYPAAVIMLDLASEMLAGATMEDVSTVLYYKVLQWAGYSRNLKVAALERRLKKDGRYPEFIERIERELQTPWIEAQNDPLVIDSVMPGLAHELYPKLFPTPTAFTTSTSDVVRFENERVKEMIDLAREATGKQHILFIIDEVGQYVGARPHLILNLDGLAKNLKSIGGGKVWIIGTAQQTLTADDPKASLNSPELYKLKDRFPIQIDLESRDIREICHRRLLGKSAEGERTLGALFDKHGQALRHNVKLEDARAYEASLDKTNFVNLYPFLPAHFDVLLHLLGALAKSTGGIGLRSAIKVIQDILIEGKPAAAERPVGWLATTVTLYDALEKDIRRAFPSTHAGVGRVQIQYPNSDLHLSVAKTIAVLQILDNMPSTAANVIALMHPGIEAPSQQAEIETAIKDLLNNPRVPIGEKDRNLRILSEKLNDIETERGLIAAPRNELRRIQNQALIDTFSPLPAAKLHGALVVTSGLKAQSGAQQFALAGDNNTIQSVIELVDPADYDMAKARLIDESHQTGARNTIFWLARSSPEIDQQLIEIHRSREIVQRHRADPDQEIKDYCAGHSGLAARGVAEVERLLRRQLSQGSFIFRAQVTAVDSLDADLNEAAKKHLASVAEQVFERFGEAPARVDTTLAEKFLRQGNLNAINSQLDPLGLVQISGGTPQINANHKALVSIHDFIDRTGNAEGKTLSEYFSDAPFGWSPDTLRYMIAAMLVGGQIKLKVSGLVVTAVGQQAIEALRTNNTFKTVGVALRNNSPTRQVLASAAKRLTDLCGDQVLPLETDICKAAARRLPALQVRYGGLLEKLSSLQLPGAETVQWTNREIDNLLAADASDAPQRLGAQESPLYQNLKWANDVDTALRAGLDVTIRDLRRHRAEIQALPDIEVTRDLNAALAGAFATIDDKLAQPNFHTHAADLNTALTAIKAQVEKSAAAMSQRLAESVRAAQSELSRIPEWTALTQEEQSQQLGDLEALVIETPDNVTGLRQRMNQSFAVQARVTESKPRIAKLGRDRAPTPPSNARVITLPRVVTTLAGLDQVAAAIAAQRSALHGQADIHVTFEIDPNA